jgi:uncharacterized surface protein with fasciclin (FAS1) repeats
LTLFAPTDNAFAALPDGLVDELLQDPTGELTQILLYHVVGAKALSTDLSDGQMITTLNGDSITVTISHGGVFIDDARVLVADFETSNGVIHVIDAVLSPYSTVLDVIVGSPDHNILETAIFAAHLDGALSGEGPLTVFAPPTMRLPRCPMAFWMNCCRIPPGTWRTYCSIMWWMPRPCPPIFPTGK